MDTRLINQVVECEWRIQMENEKMNNHHPDSYSSFQMVLEYCGKVAKSTLQHFTKSGLSHILPIHFSETI